MIIKRYKDSKGYYHIEKLTPVWIVDAKIQEVNKCEYIVGGKEFYDEVSAKLYDLFGDKAPPRNFYSKKNFETFEVIPITKSKVVYKNESGYYVYFKRKNDKFYLYKIEKEYDLYTTKLKIPDEIIGVELNEFIKNDYFLNNEKISK